MDKKTVIYFWALKDIQNSKGFPVNIRQMKRLKEKKSRTEIPYLLNCRQSSELEKKWQHNFYMQPRTMQHMLFMVRKK